jgi:fructose-specific component phosphotransferase system IIB-like protein
MIKTLQLLKRERTVVSRERTQGLYTAFEYLISKTFAELPFDATVAAVFGSLLHAHSRLNGDRLVFTGVLCLLSCATSTLGLAIGAAFPKGDVALAVGPALMVVYVIVGAIGPAGVGHKLPWFMKAFRSLSPIKPSCEALCVSELGNWESAVKSEKKNLWQKFSQLISQLFLKKSSRNENPVLSSLGILPSTTVRSSMFTLVKMTTIHTVCALIGLILNNASE